MFSIWTPARVPLAILEGYTSMQWERKYHTAGSFELHIPYSADVAPLLAAENLIVKGNEAGIVENLHLEYDGKRGGDIIVAKGRFLAAYCDRRILWGTQSITGAQEDVMAALATRCLTSTAGAGRAIPDLSVASSGGRGASIDYNEGNVNLLDQLEELSEAADVGFRVDFASDGLTFRTFQGLDRTTEQSTNTRAIFSRHFENVLKQEYDYDSKKARNVALVTHEKDDVEYTETVGTETGTARREMVVKGSRLNKDEDGNELTETQFRALMQEQGAAKLAGYPVKTSFEAQVDPSGNLVYKTDYDLGDKVTVDAPEWGLRVHTRITAITETYEKEGLSVELTLGNGLTTIKQIVRWYNG